MKSFKNLLFSISVCLSICLSNYSSVNVLGEVSEFSLECHTVRISKHPSEPSESDTNPRKIPEGSLPISIVVALNEEPEND